MSDFSFSGGPLQAQFILFLIPPSIVLLFLALVFPAQFSVAI